MGLNARLTIDLSVLVHEVRVSNTEDRYSSSLFREILVLNESHETGKILSILRNATKKSVWRSHEIRSRLIRDVGTAFTSECFTFWTLHKKPYNAGVK